MTVELINGDCLVEMKKLKDKSIDFVFLDLPYGQTACAWDKKLDLKALWVELKRIAKNERTPFFFTTTTKFGFELFNNAPKGYFRWDLVWEKNRAAGFLNAYKLPMRKHEMVYCFAKKTPEYDVSSHLTGEKSIGNSSNHKYLKELHGERVGREKDHIKKETKEPLPTSILPPQEDHELVYCFAKKTPEYDVSSHLTGEKSIGNSSNHKYLKEFQSRGQETSYYEKDHIKKEIKEPLPTSILDIPSSWCKYKLDSGINHRTAKPVKLMEFLLKYWSKEGDTILDPTAGSGSMGVACKNLNRKFIGIEKDETIYKIMCDRLETNE